MKASELRICNLIFTHKEEIIVVKDIDIEGLILFKEDQNIFDFKCKPIPLTEERLLKFGFEKDTRDRVMFMFKNFKISIESESFIHYSMYSNHAKIKYVHQLQNLYFALTGEELTIKD